MRIDDRGLTPLSKAAKLCHVYQKIPREFAERKKPEEERTGWHEERAYGKVTRSLKLPETIDPESIEATVADGVLHVTVAKTPEAQPKRIDVK